MRITALLYRALQPSSKHTYACRPLICSWSFATAAVAFSMRTECMSRVALSFSCFARLFDTYRGGASPHRAEEDLLLLPPS